MNVTEFVEALCALPWPKVPDKAGLRQYIRYLNNEPLNSGQLDEVYRILTDEGKWFPLLSEVKLAVRTAKRNSVSDQIWQTWQDEHGRPYARKIQDPGRMPDPPEGIESTNLVLPESLQFNENQISGAEARAAFEEGYKQAGGDVGKLREYAKAVKP